MLSLKEEELMLTFNRKLTGRGRTLLTDSLSSILYRKSSRPRSQLAHLKMHLLSMQSKNLQTLDRETEMML